MPQHARETIRVAPLDRINNFTRGWAISIRKSPPSPLSSFSLEESSWCRITGAFRPSLPLFRQTCARAHIHAHIRAPSNRPSKAQPVFGFGTVSNRLFALPRANIYQGTTRVDFRSYAGGILVIRGRRWREKNRLCGDATRRGGDEEGDEGRERGARLAG